MGTCIPKYDPDGNLLTDPTTCTNVNQYDAEGHATQFESVVVLYDALGRPVEAGSTEILYAPDGSKIGHMSGQTEADTEIPLPGGGEAVYKSGALSYYGHADWQGSTTRGLGWGSRGPRTGRASGGSCGIAARGPAPINRLASTPARGLADYEAYAAYGKSYQNGAGNTQDFTGQPRDERRADGHPRGPGTG